MTTPSPTRTYEAREQGDPTSSAITCVPSAMTSLGSRNDVNDWVAPFIKRPRRARSSESRTLLSRLLRKWWIVTVTTTETAVHRKSRRRIVASLLCTTMPATVMLTKEAATTITEYEVG